MKYGVVEPTLDGIPRDRVMKDRVEIESVEQPLILIADPRDFIRSGLALWVGASEQSFHVRLVPDFSSCSTEDLAAASLAIVYADANVRHEAWLGKQVLWLRERRPHIAVAAVVEDGESARVERFTSRLGVNGLIPTSSSMSVAAAVLRLILAGGSHFPRLSHASNTGKPIEESIVRVDPDDPMSPKLTPREQAVFDLVSRGMPNKVIAKRLELSLSTVKIHVHHIIQKLKVQNRTEVAVMGRESVVSSDMSHEAAPGNRISTSSPAAASL